MKEKPILFSGPMVRAILEGRKTQTRRVVKPQPPSCYHFVHYRQQDTAWNPITGPAGFYAGFDYRPDNPDPSYYRCPYGQPGDRLWVRETWADTSKESLLCPVSYRATWPPEDEEGRGFNWQPSIHMPRWASRIDLEVTGVRVERVQDITEEDAKEEGCSQWDMDCPWCLGSGTVRSSIDQAQPSCPCGLPGMYHYNFRVLWDSINASRGYGWDANPWVWVVSFRRCE